MVNAAEKNQWRGLAYGNGVWVAVSSDGANQVQYSTDGALTWTSASASQQAQWFDVTFGDGKFVAVARGTATQMYSTDGINWSASPASEANGWNAVNYGGGKFVAVSLDGNNQVMWSYGGTGIAAVPNLTFTGDKDLKYFDPGDAITHNSSLRTSNITNVEILDGTWNGLTALDNGQVWQAISYGGGKYVTVGSLPSQQNLAYSTDGISWTIGNMPGTSVTWTDVAYANGTWVAIANSQGTVQVATSADGVTWTATPQGSTQTNPHEGLAYGNGVWVVVASNGAIMYSADTQVWTSGIDPESGSSNWVEVTFGAGRFVAVALNAGTNRAMYSTNGINWTSTSSISQSSWRVVLYGAGKFVAVGAKGFINATYSTDGATWYTATVPAALGNDSFGAMAFDGTKFVAGSLNGTGSTMSSTDGVTWTQETPPPTGPFQFNNGLTYGAGKFVGTFQTTPSVQWSYTGTGVNKTSLTFTDDKDLANFEANDNVYGGPASLTSTNTITNVNVASGAWIAGSTFTGGMASGQYRSLVYGDGKFVACSLNPSSARIIYSTDGKNWLEAVQPPANGWGGVALGVDSLSGNPLWIAVANNGNNNRLIKSSNGINWQNGSTSSVVGTKNWTCLAYGNGRFVALSGSSQGMYSTDGNTWVLSSLPTGLAYRNVAFGGATGEEKFVGVSNNSGIVYSTNGSSWTRVSPVATGRDWQDVCWGNDKWVAVSYGGTNRVAYSSDGSSWTDVTTLGALDSASWQTVTYGPSGFVAIAATGSPHVMTSPDGVTWTAGLLESPLTLPSWSSIAYGAGVYAVVSNNSAMWSNSGSGLNTNELFIAGAVTDGFIVNDVLTTDSTGGSGTITNLTNTSVTVSSPSGFQTGQRIVTSGLTANGTVASTDPSARTMSLSTSNGRWAIGNPAFGPESTTTGNVNTVTVGSNQMTVNNVNGRFIVGRPVSGPVKLLPPPAPSGDVPGVEYALTDRALASSDLETHNLAPYPSGIFSSSNTITNVSSDAVGSPWVSTGPVFNDAWNSVAFNGTSQFVVVGNSAAMYKSDNKNATNWTQVSSGPVANDDFESIASDGNGTYVAVGRQGMVSYSATGNEPWTSFFIGSGYSGSPWVNWGVAYGDGVWCICGDSSAGHSNIYRSTNGLSWDAVSTPFNPSNGQTSIATDGAGNWVCIGQGGEIGYSSDNGLTWTLSASSNYAWSQPGGVAYGNGVWMAAFKDTSTIMVRSTDNGVTWSQVGGTILGTARPTSFAYGNGVWFGTAQNASLITSTNDGQGWSVITAPAGYASEGFNQVIYGGEVFVLVGEGLIATAPAGSTTFTIVGCLSDGFVPGDVIDDCGGDAQEATITSVSNTQVVVAGNPSGWTVGDSICRPGGVTANSTFFSHVRYRSNDPIDSAWSNWSAFTTGAFVPEPGDALGGGYFVAQILDTGVIYNIIIAPGGNPGGLQSEGAAALGGAGTGNYPNMSPMTSSVYGGTATAAMAANGDSPLALEFNNVNGPNGGPINLAGGTPTGTGIGGYTDWYCPARNELEVLYRMLKPRNVDNGQRENPLGGVLIGGNNPDSVPPYNQSYTPTSPAQTPAVSFQDTNANSVKWQSGPQQTMTAKNETPSTQIQMVQDFADGQILEYPGDGRPENLVQWRAIRRQPAT